MAALNCTLFFAICCLFTLSNAQIVNNTNDSDISSSSSSSTPFISTTTMKPSGNQTCEKHEDCTSCISGSSECYFCSEKNRCIYRLESIISDGKCNIKNAYYLTCKMTMKTMFILIGLFASIVALIILVICCYCCCKKKGIKLSKDDIKWARQKEERQQIAAERRKERADRAEEIRKKYGLNKDNNPYQRFDA